MDPTSSIDSFLKLLSDALSSNNWLAIAALAVVAAVAGTRKFVGPKVPFLMTQRGGSLLVLGMSLAGGLATALLAGNPLSWALALKVISVAVTAAGGRTLLLRLLFGDRASAVEEAAAATGAAAGAAASTSAPSPSDLVNK